MPDTDLLTLEDSQSSVDGKPYIFKFARSNRRPVLNYIEDIFLYTSQKYTLTPIANDADEDFITYTYSGDATLPTFSFPLSGYYNITVTARDNSLEDFQHINISIMPSKMNNHAQKLLFGKESASVGSVEWIFISSKSL